jgi:hypothetical protein
MLVKKNVKINKDEWKKDKLMNERTRTHTHTHTIMTKTKLSLIGIKTKHIF